MVWQSMAIMFVIGMIYVVYGASRFRKMLAAVQ
jgi:hypothetical protein